MRPPELSSTQSRYAVALATAFQVKVGVLVAMLPEGATRVAGGGGGVPTTVNASALHERPPRAAEDGTDQRRPGPGGSSALEPMQQEQVPVAQPTCAAVWVVRMVPPKRASTRGMPGVAPATAFQVNVGVPVAMLPDGASRVAAPGGVLLSMVNTSALEVPPPGVGENTVTDAVPAVARSAAVTAAVSRVALTNVVVRAAPFQRTLEPLTK